MDQGLFAVSNFLVNVMLARWLAPEDYGAFTVAYAALLLLGTAHTALLTEPMLVFGPSRYRDTRVPYLRALVEGHWMLTAIGSLLLIAAGGIAWGSGGAALARALIGLGVVSPLLLLPWLLRRACYVRLQSWLAAVGGGIYLGAVITGLAVLGATAALSVPAALGVMGAASLLAGGWLAFRLHVGFTPGAPREVRSDALREHWEYGRWSMATLALSWIPANIYYFVLPAHRGLEASGGLKALLNLILPIQHVNTALAVFLVPVFVKARGTAEFAKLVRYALAAFAAGSLAYWGLIAVCSGPVQAWLYRGRYSWGTEVLWPLAIFLLMTVVVNVLGGALRAVERPDQVFRANVPSTLVALTVGAWAANQWGVAGASIALALGAAVKAAGMWGYYRRLRPASLRREERPLVSASPAV
ncbi:MAG TPA: polysaccharide biosynthesis C-terminal domain-containing protein [bacterium]|nr:polysaccharide biosynthesis C-terminal domain-containing protein [bacterium]